MPKPELLIIAGPNGAGKTTTVSYPPFREALAHCEFINPDAVTLGFLNQLGYPTWESVPPGLLKDTFIRAANQCEEHIMQRIEAGAAIAVETVLSTQKYCATVERVLELGGDFFLVYVALNSPELSAQRVDHRVRTGGHGVPADKLAPRWKASLELLPWFALRATSFWIVDNSDTLLGEPGSLMISGIERQMVLHGVPAGPMRSIVGKFIKDFDLLDQARCWRLEIDNHYIQPCD
jgi:predicted ABC-type ATPase